MCVDVALRLCTGETNWYLKDCENVEKCCASDDSHEKIPVRKIEGHGGDEAMCPSDSLLPNTITLDRYGKEAASKKASHTEQEDIISRVYTLRCNGQFLRIDGKPLEGYERRENEVAETTRKYMSTGQGLGEKVSVALGEQMELYYGWFDTEMLENCRFVEKE